MTDQAISPKQKQDIVDRVVHGIIKQGGPGYDDAHGECVWLTQDGYRCAIGMVMTDDELFHLGKHRLNVYPVFGDVDELIDDRKLDFESGEFLRAIQSAHDNAIRLDQSVPLIGPSDFMPTFLKNMREVCQEYGLSFPLEDGKVERRGS